jgi:hypothetical protein
MKSFADRWYYSDKSRRQPVDRDALEQWREDTSRASDPVPATFGRAVERGPIGRARGDGSRMSHRVSEVAMGDVAAGTAEDKSVRQGVDDIVRERPLAPPGTFAPAAWILGATP